MYEGHKNSVNSLAFAPNEYGLIFLCGSSDGTISLHEYKNDNWNVILKPAHTGGVNSVSWAPSISPSNQNDDNSNGSLAPLRFVTAGCDNDINIWTMNNTNVNDISKGKLTCETLKGHTDWVRDVSWLNFPGYNTDIIASAGEDEVVYLWTKSEDNKWENKELYNFKVPVWRVNWSQCGSYLAVTAGDNCTYLFKENIDKEWTMISAMNQEGNMEKIEGENN